MRHRTLEIMRIFVAGATGAIGRRLVPMLVTAGYEVTAMTRTPSKTASLQAAGASPVVCDALDRAALRAAVAAARPDVVVDQLTDIPKALNPKRIAQELAPTNRLRQEGTRNLIDAAVAAGARRFIAQSIAFAYAPIGGPVKQEDDPLALDAPEPIAALVEAVHDLERTVTGTAGIEGLVLR